MSSENYTGTFVLLCIVFLSDAVSISWLSVLEDVRFIFVHCSWIDWGKQAMPPLDDSVKVYRYFGAVSPVCKNVI